MAVETVDTDAPEVVRSSAIRDTISSLSAVFRNPSLRRVQLALTGSMVGDWAYATAVTVWAYSEGGTTAVGVWGAVRLTLMALFAPAAASLSDRFPRKAVMVASDVSRAVLVVAAAACLRFDASPWTIYVLATMASLTGSIFRPAQMSLMPSLVDRPEELSASNGASSTIESLAFFVGPALGAFLVAAFDVETVFLVNAGTYVWSTVLVLGIRVPKVEVTGGGEPDGPGEKEGMLQEMAAGFSTIWRDPNLLVIMGLVAFQTLIAGSTLVLTVVFALDLLETGPEGVGYVDSAFGVGAILGGFWAIARTPKAKLASDLAIGVLLWSFPLILLVVWQSPVAVFAAVVLMGFGNPMVDVSYATLIQRLTPDEVLGRVFGAGEGVLIASMALGSAITPLMLDHLGLRTTLTLLALAAGVPAIVMFAKCRGLDQSLVAPPGLELLRSLPLFHPLGPVRLESLARRMERIVVPAGTTIVTEGETGERFYVIESGQVTVSRDDLLLRHQGAGNFFGEIALLRDVPRTATVTAEEDTELFTIERGDFLDAVTGSEDSMLVADDIVSRRITT